MTARTYWWETRREGERSNDYLGRVLDALHAEPLAANARAYHYDDYFCPDDIDDGMPQHRLLSHLHEWVRTAPNVNEGRLREVCQAVVDGEFDGTKEESEEWAASPSGQAVFKELVDPDG